MGYQQKSQQKHKYVKSIIKMLEQLHSELSMEALKRRHCPYFAVFIVSKFVKGRLEMSLLILSEFKRIN